MLSFLYNSSLTFIHDYQINCNFDQMDLVGMSLLFNMLSRLEKEMETYSSTLAWRILGMEEPGGLPSMESHRVSHN